MVSWFLPRPTIVHEGDAVEMLAGIVLLITLTCVLLKYTNARRGLLSTAELQTLSLAENA